MATHIANALQALGRVREEMSNRTAANGMELAAWQRLLAYASIEVGSIRERSSPDHDDAPEERVMAAHRNSAPQDIAWARIMEALCGACNEGCVLDNGRIWALCPMRRLVGDVFSEEEPKAAMRGVFKGKKELTDRDHDDAPEGA